MSELLERLERYYDAAPRSGATVEVIGPLTLFVAEPGGWPYYGRPSAGTTAVTAGDVAAVRERQRTLGVPESFEWVAEVTPALATAARGAGLTVAEHPLMVLSEPLGEPPLPAGASVRLLGADDDLARAAAVADVAFRVRGTDAGAEGVAEAEAARAARAPAAIERQRARLRRGLTVTAAAFLDGELVASGSHQPVGAVTEIVGVATLPAFRRRGLGAGVTAVLAADARRRGCEIVFLSADTEEVARVYGRLGFRRVATACIAEPAG